MEKRCAAIVFVFGLALSGCAVEPAAEEVASESAALGQGNGPGCFDSTHCPNGQLCQDPRYPLCGIPMPCEGIGGMVQCGCRCQVACIATTCAADEECTDDGCCRPRACKNAHDCRTPGDHCLDGFCARRGSCIFPPL